jgi:hypothetical protein
MTKTIFSICSILIYLTIPVAAWGQGENRHAIVEDPPGKSSQPWFDVTHYGARSVSSVPLTTATCGANSTKCTLASGALFQNGDTIRLDFAGPATTLTAPTDLKVTPAVSAGGSTIASFTGVTPGTTSYAYKVIACDADGGCTGASSSASTSVGPANLGRITATTSSISLKNQTLTVTTTAPHRFSPHALVYITYFGTHTPLFEGFYIVATTPNPTTFTINVSYDSRVMGTPVLDKSAAEVASFNGIQITWKPVPNADKYYVFGRGGTFDLIGVTDPQYNSFTDFGPTMEGHQIFPSYVPVSAPSEASNQYLLTRIVFGGGTNTIVIADPTIRAITNKNALFGNDSAFRSAFTAAAATYAGTIYIPVGTYPLAGRFTLPFTHNGYKVLQAGTIEAYEPIEMTHPIDWSGFAVATTTAFQWVGNATINSQGARPLIHLPAGASGSKMSNLLLNTNAPNAGLLVLEDTLTNMTMEYMSFAESNGGTDDYMGRIILSRGDFSFRFVKDNFLGGEAPTTGRSSVGFSFIPGITFAPRIDGTDTAGGNFVFEHCWAVGKAGIEQSYAPGLPGGGPPGGVNFAVLRDIQPQNLMIPLYEATSWPNSAGLSGNITLDGIISADFPTALFANYSPAFAQGITANSVQVGSGGRNAYTGNPIVGVNGMTMGLNREGTAFGTGIANNSPTFGNYQGSQFQMREQLDMSAGHGVTEPLPATAAPKVSATSCGPNPCLRPGIYAFVVVPVGVDGGTFAPGVSSAPFVADGAHNALVTWTDVAGVQGYQVFLASSGGGLSLSPTCGGGNFGTPTVVAANSCTAGGNFFDGPIGQIATSGLPSMYPGLLTTKTLRFGSTDHGNYGYLNLGGNFTGVRNQSMPDASGPIALEIFTSLTTTSATTDKLKLQGMTSTGHCTGLTPTNASAAANIATTFVSGKSTNQITVTHAPVSGMTYDIACAPY